MMGNRKATGLWIPPEIMGINTLSFFDKAVLSEICNLGNDKDCFAGNKYLSAFFGCSIRTITRTITELERQGFVEISSVQGKSRTIKVTMDKMSTGYGQNVYSSMDKMSTGCGQNVQGSIDKMSTVNNNKEKKEEIKGEKIGYYSSSSIPLQDQNDDEDEEIAEVVAYYNEHKNNLPQCSKPSAKTKRLIASTLAEYGKETVLNIIHLTEFNDFLQGRKPNTSIRVNLEWLFNPNNFRKVYDGYYKEDQKEPREKAAWEKKFDEIYGG